MKKLLLSITAGAMLLGATGSAYAFQCGLKPLPPLGFTYSDGVCVCDQYNNCRWMWVK